MARIGVIGGGAFGTAMACVVRRSGHDTTIWAREPEVADMINRYALNPIFLPGTRMTPGIVATNELAVAVARADFLLLAPPAQHMRAVWPKWQVSVLRWVRACSPIPTISIASRRAYADSERGATRRPRTPRVCSSERARGRMIESFSFRYWRTV